MTNPQNPTRLRYVDADQLDSGVLDLAGLDVRNDAGDHLGDVDGLLIDGVSGRPRYLVVDSGGWFRSRRFLLPVAHARLDHDRKALRVAFDRDTISRFPEMRDERFDALTDDELRTYDEGVMTASGLRPERGEVVTGADYTTSPPWWNSAAWAQTPVPGAPTVSTGRPALAAESREHVVGRSSEDLVARSERERLAEHERDLRDRDADDLRTPAVGERAQPGDILGIESAGETTSLGDTGQDEDRRREEADKELRKMRDERDRTREI